MALVLLSGSTTPRVLVLLPRMTQRRSVRAFLGHQHGWVQVPEGRRQVTFDVVQAPKASRRRTFRSLDVLDLSGTRLIPVPENQSRRKAGFVFCCG